MTKTLKLKKQTLNGTDPSPTIYLPVESIDYWQQSHEGSTIFTKSGGRINVEMSSEALSILYEAYYKDTVTIGDMSLEKLTKTTEPRSGSNEHTPRIPAQPVMPHSPDQPEPLTLKKRITKFFF